MKPIPFHSIAAVFPVMEAEELERLADDIQANGLREPVTLFEGKILDGRNRANACLMRGIALQTREFCGSRWEALAFVWSENRMRRHLTSSQAGMGEAKRAKLSAEYAAEVERLKDEARERQAQAVGEPRGRKKSVRQRIDAQSDNRHPTETARAQSAGTNRTYVVQAEQLLNQAPDLADQVEAGRVTIPQARTELQRRQKRKELAAKAATAEQHRAAGCPTWEIRHGDCLAVLPTLTERGRLIFADPPYNIGVDYGDGKTADKLDDAVYLAWVEQWLAVCREGLTPDGSLWVLIGDEYAAEYGVTLKRLGLAVRSWLKWWEAFGVNCARNFNRCSRHLFYCVRDPKQFVFNEEAVTRPSERQAKYGDKRANPGGKLWDNVWGIEPPIPRLTGTCRERIPDIPTQLPLAMLTPIVLCASEPGDLVVDPFSGSGTTGVAAIQHGRRYLGIERSRRFVELSSLRLKGVGCE